MKTMPWVTRLLSPLVWSQGSVGAEIDAQIEIIK
jgi:hypothetical protein